MKNALEWHASRVIYRAPGTSKATELKADVLRIEDSCKKTVRAPAALAHSPGASHLDPATEEGIKAAERPC